MVHSVKNLSDSLVKRRINSSRPYNNVGVFPAYFKALISVIGLFYGARRYIVYFLRAKLTRRKINDSRNSFVYNALEVLRSIINYRIRGGIVKNPIWVVKLFLKKLFKSVYPAVDFLLSVLVNGVNVRPVFFRVRVNRGFVKGVV